MTYIVSKARRPLGSVAVEIRVDPQQLRRNLQAIVGERSPFSGQRHLAEVESFIEKELASYGLAVESDTFSYRGKNFRNLVCRLLLEKKKTLIILGAHFDSVEGTPGADDNASGLAVLLEAARLISRASVRCELLSFELNC